MLNYKDYVYAVYREGSFSKAAKSLYVSQPWLSTTIKKAEQEFGISIFNRSTTPISLTESGKYYIAQIEKILQIEHEMQEYFSVSDKVGRGHLSIGSSTFFCVHVLPSLLSRFRQRFPQISISLLENSPEYLVKKLLNRDIDMMIEAEALKHKEYVSLPLFTEEIMLAVPACNPINEELAEYAYTFSELSAQEKNEYSKPAVSIGKFANEPFLFLQQENDIYVRGMQICKNAGFTPNVRLYLNQMVSSYYLACDGYGIAFIRSIIPKYVAYSDQILFYRLTDSLVKRNIYLSYCESNVSPLQQLLIDFIAAQMT